MQKKKKQALETLGLAEDATQSEIERAYKMLNAFADAKSASTRSLVEDYEADVELAYQRAKNFDDLETNDTDSSIKKKNSQTASNNSEKPLLWLVGAILVVGLVYQASHKTNEISHRTTHVAEDVTSQAPVSPPFSQQQSSADRPPNFVLPFIHSDDVRSRVTKWSSNDSNFNGSQSTTVWAYAANGDPVYKIELYSDNGTWREQRQYVVRYSSNRLQVDVQRFESKDSALVFKDQRNLSATGDALVQTTIYMFSTDNKLSAVQVDTPFVTAKDGLRITRPGGTISVERVPLGGQVNLSDNPKWLENLFDLWNVFGAPNL